MRNSIDLFLKYLAALGGIGSVGYLIFSILTASTETVSEALKYFSVTIVIFIALILYIELVVKKGVKG